jgi:purine-nucleoside phosphorylase
MGLESGMFDLLFGCSQEEISEKVIMTPFLNAEKFVGSGVKKKIFSGRLYSGINMGSGKDCYTVVKCPMGSGLAGDAVMFLGETRARKIVYVGSCGGFHDSSLGDILLCEKAFSGGSFFDYYPPGKGIAEILSSEKFFSASDSLRSELSLRAEGLGEGPRLTEKGSVFTTASLFAETPENLKLVEKRGFYGIDMELAAVYHASIVSGIEAAGILFVSDLPLRKSFWNVFSSEEKKNIKAAARKAVKIATLFCGKNLQV